jgi:uncharacterized membrane protein
MCPADFVVAGKVFHLLQRGRADSALPRRWPPSAVLVVEPAVRDTLCAGMQAGRTDAPMAPRARRSTARIGGHPIHPMLVPFPIAFFAGTLLTDVAYWQTAEVMWANFSAWLVSAGVIMGWLAGIVGLVDFLGRRAVRTLPAAWLHGGGNVAALILATVNMLVHTRDAWTSVVPWGLVLSAVVVIILLVTGWLGGTLVYRHGVGVEPVD